MKAGEDAQTTTTDGSYAEKPALTRHGRFCQKHKINPMLIFLKVSLFFMYGGKWIRLKDRELLTSFAQPINIELRSTTTCLWET